MEHVLMPQLGETVTEGTIVRWLKAPGDPVAADDVLFEVSTDKVDTEVPSAHAGVLRAVYVHEGDTVPIGTLLAVITDTADEVVPDPATTAPLGAGAGPDNAATIARDSAPLPSPGPSHSPPPPSPVDRAAARAGGSGFLSPVVARLLAERGLPPDAVVGTGRDGRITRADVEAAAANRVPAPPDAPASWAVTVGTGMTGYTPVVGPGTFLLPGGRPPLPPVPIAVADGDEIVELSRARRATAENMMRSLATAAHTLVVTEVDYHAVDGVRRAAGLSYLPFVARAVIDALRAFPHLNASLDDDRLIVHRAVHLGFAVDVDFAALVVPVVHEADGHRLRTLSDEIAALAARARSKRLTADDFAGGTFTITNVGSYGTVVTAPIINQPQVAILSTDGVRMKPVAVRGAPDEWTVAVHPIGNLSLSFDHRANDGAYASAFLARVREILETRDWAQEV
jgi:2-oxoglutarate dehydrogenase E2 component (dihydrolipoamide succinyltransferase)